MLDARTGTAVAPEVPRLPSRALRRSKRLTAGWPGHPTGTVQSQAGPPAGEVGWGGLDPVSAVFLKTTTIK